MIVVQAVALENFPCGRTRARWNVEIGQSKSVNKQEIVGQEMQKKNLVNKICNHKNLEVINFSKNFTLICIQIIFTGRCPSMFVI